ncbi:hypothetical protein KJ616_00625 [Patescibacteria group bacterium]|nr:hypothetical protein [Patescibacteria group bacterium]
MTEVFKRESQVKSAILENLGKERRRRKYIILGTIAFFLAIRLAIKPFPYFYYITAGCLLSLFLIIPATHYLKKDSKMKIGVIRLIVGAIIFIELLTLGAVLYFFMPVALFYQMRISIIAIPFFLLYAVLIYPLLVSRKSNDLFYFFSLVMVSALSLLEYAGRYPDYSHYPISEEPALALYAAIIPIVIALFIFLTMRSSMSQFWGQFSKMNLELKGLNIELEEKVKERTTELQKKSEELEEAKNILEIKVAARTRELEESAEQLEENIKLRTKELQERIDELETFHKLTVGRELKMIELKKEIEDLKEQLISRQKNE